MRKEGITLMFGGLAGFISVAIIQLLTIDVNKLDIWLSLGLSSFSIALPLCIFLIVSTQSEFGTEGKSSPRPAPKWYILLCTATGMTGAFGITALFSHFSPGLGIVFGLTSLAALVALDRMNPHH